MYDNGVERPKAWPKVSGVVLSSRVVAAESEESLYEPRAVNRDGTEPRLAGVETWRMVE